MKVKWNLEKDGDYIRSLLRVLQCAGALGSSMMESANRGDTEAESMIPGLIHDINVICRAHGLPEIENAADGIPLN